MERKETLEQLVKERLVAICRLTSPQEALQAAEAIRDSGFRFIEITLSFEEWPAVIEEMASWPDVVPGVGTVMTATDAQLAASLGARYVVSPHTDPSIVRAARDAGALAIPGAATPTEIATAWRSGADLIKLFPAPILGGPDYIRVLQGPLPDVRYLVTGNITPEMIRSYLQTGVVVALGLGSPVLPPDAVQTGDWHRVREAARSVRNTLN